MDFSDEEFCVSVQMCADKQNGEVKTTDFCNDT